MEEVQRVKWCVSLEAGLIFGITGEKLTGVVLHQFCCAVMKGGNLLLCMRRGCVGWSVIRSG